MGEYRRIWQWVLLSTILPIIGPIITWGVKKDENPDLASVAKWILIVEAIALLVRYATLNPWIALVAGIAIYLWRYFSETENEYRAWYIVFGLPIVGFFIVILGNYPGEVKKDVAILAAIAIAIWVISVALAVVAYTWFMSMQASVQQDIQQQTAGNLAKIGKYRFHIDSVGCENGKLQIFLRNMSTEDIENQTFTVILKDQSRRVLKTETIAVSIKSGDVTTLTIPNTSNDCTTPPGGLIVEVHGPTGATELATFGG